MNFSLANALILFLLTSTSLSAKIEKLALSINAEAAILINADTGAILFEKNGNELHYPASTTKIATALYALQKIADKMNVMVAADQDCIGTVKEEAIRKSNYTLASYLLIPDGSHIGIKRGELLSIRDLFFGMMVASGDDAANVIAKFTSGTIPKFIEEMNVFVKKLGLKSTTFYNPHGLHHPNQKTTAYDLALLTREALKNPLFCEMVATVRYTRPKTNKQESSTLVQTNRLLRPGPYFYSKAIGVKTGYYSIAGNNLVAAAKDGERTLIAVVLKTKERKDIFLDTKKMFEAAFNQPKIQRVFLKKGVQKFTLNLEGTSKPINCYLKEDITLEYYPAEEPSAKCFIAWDKNLKLPLLQNQQLGEVVLQLENGQKISQPLYSVKKIKETWSSTLKNFFPIDQMGKNVFKILMIFLFLVGGLFLIFKFRKT